MPERDFNRPKTTDEWMDHISEFAHKWEVGTPEHCAVNDFLNLQRLYGQFGEEPQNLLDQMNGEASLSPENRASRDLQRIVLLEHTIEQNQARVPGYSDAYMHLNLSFLDLLGAASGEAKTKFSEEETKQTEYIKNIYEEALGYVYSDLFDKQNRNL